MDENNVPQAPPDDDRTPTQDDAAPARKGSDWVMPEPVFRKSSGYLPKGFEQRIRAAVAAEPALDENEIADEVAEPSQIPDSQDGENGFAEQPDITEDPSAEGAVAAPVLETTPAPQKKRRGFFRWLLLIVGVLLAIGAVAALVAVGIFWYLMQPSASENFN